MGNHLETLSRPESDCNAFFSQQKGPLQRGKVSQILTAATGQHPPYPTPTARSYTVTGAEPPKELLDGEQRLHRVAATNGRLELLYNAMVSVEPELLEDKGLGVASLHELPLEALVFLYPSPLPIRFAR